MDTVTLTITGIDTEKIPLIAAVLDAVTGKGIEYYTAELTDTTWTGAYVVEEMGREPAWEVAGALVATETQFAIGMPIA